MLQQQHQAPASDAHAPARHRIGFGPALLVIGSDLGASARYRIGFEHLCSLSDRIRRLVLVIGSDLGSDRILGWADQAAAAHTPQGVCRPVLVVRPGVAWVPP